MIKTSHSEEKKQRPPRAQHFSVSDVMTVDPVCVEPCTGIRELARVFEENEISGVPVVDQRGVLVGVVSRTDLIRRCLQGTDELPPAHLFEILSEQGPDSEILAGSLICVEDLMTEGPLTVTPDEKIAPVARRMCDARFHRVVVVDQENMPVGILTSMDLLEAFSRA